MALIQKKEMEDVQFGDRSQSFLLEDEFLRSGKFEHEKEVAKISPGDRRRKDASRFEMSRDEEKRLTTPL